MQLNRHVCIQNVNETATYKNFSFASKIDLSASFANDEWQAGLNGVAFIHGALFPAQTAQDAVSATAK